MWEDPRLNSNNAIPPRKRPLVEDSKCAVLARQAALGLVLTNPHGRVVVGYVDYSSTRLTSSALNSENEYTTKT